MCWRLLVICRQGVIGIEIVISLVLRQPSRAFILPGGTAGNLALKECPAESLRWDFD